MFKILDLFCGAGGSAMGLSRAGFEVVGVDIEPQPNYPFEFHQADALEYPLGGFDAYWASPPCQAYTRMAQGLLQSQGNGCDYPDLLAPTREMLIATNKPYIIENVPGAPMLGPIQLCGSWFGLNVQRHRLFECNLSLWGTPCAHYWQKPIHPPLHRSITGYSRVIGVYGNGRGKGDNKSAWIQAMNINWMTRKELTQAIPPSYSLFLGGQLIKLLAK